MAKEQERPAKRAKLLDGSDDSDSDAGVKLNINEEYAKRFEHNKKREEKHRLEEKYKDEPSFKRKRSDEDEDEEEDSEDDESEDDDAQLATEDVDDEIMETLRAIKSKDPRVYDSNVRFFKDFDPEQVGAADIKKEKPMYLQDYHRENLLAGRTGEEEEDEKPQTYAEEQEQLKRELVGSMHAAGFKEEEDDDDFMVAKSRPKHEDLPAAKTSKKPEKKITDDDIKTADKDPETYLSNFMASRAWLPGEDSRWQAFDSDDSDDEKRADEFEEAYNMRFEDPTKANEKLQSFARDVGKYGVRREEKSGRAKARERERERKEAEKKERDEEKARLRKLKIEDAEEKVKKIKDAAGIRGQGQLNLDEWRDVIEGDFDDEKWEAEMKRRFGEQYYADEDEEMGSGDEDAASKKKKPKKPKWDDDIDIGDLVPDFDDGEKPNITLTDDEDDAEGGVSLMDDDDETSAKKKKKKTKKDREKEKADAKRTARKERMQIEEMVDAALPLHEAAASSSNGAPIGFRYRETSPTTFGLSARDILFADDSALNQYAGLKKMAAFRDEDAKKRDKKKYSKKQRLKQWRKETFGKTDEPEGGFEKVLGYEEEQPVPQEEGNVKEGARKKKRSKGKNTKSNGAGETVDA